MTARITSLPMQVASVLGSLSAQHLLDVLGVVGVLLIMFAETGLLVGFFLPGDSLLFVAGYATVAHNSLHFTLSLPGLLVAAPVGAILGAQLGYELGRRAGPRLFSRSESRLFRPEYVERSGDVLRRFGYARSIVLARFVPIVRTFLNPMAGAAAVPARTFALWNVVGGLVWTIGLLLLGHAIGDVGVIRRHIELLALFVVLLSVLPLAFEVTRRARKAR
ncbi:MAG: rane-associated protein [Frankiaceae bacterium]|jgi:membrane-associated protein|nr:rane-associated protein [Frankiaceae bacterium]